ncbi:hypothetical protein MUB24_12105 [Lederbergia sp. NSJ-179]|nr:hypothetical protein [Lederbergia sp. NSJ-179]MCJ7841626.1 hypothetical protein [Lederbergia sp. NSJ-179]
MKIAENEADKRVAMSYLNTQYVDPLGFFTSKGKHSKKVAAAVQCNF